MLTTILETTQYSWFHSNFCCLVLELAVGVSLQRAKSHHYYICTYIFTCLHFMCIHMHVFPDVR